MWVIRWSAFSEDALRIMRAVRFSAQLGFEIEEETKAGISRLTQNLRNVSAERIQAELVKLLVSPHPDYLRVAYETGITKEFLPEFDALHGNGTEHPVPLLYRWRAYPAQSSCMWRRTRCYA